jgi:hypothetical protein
MPRLADSLTTAAVTLARAGSDADDAVEQLVALAGGNADALRRAQTRCEHLFSGRRPGDADDPDGELALGFLRGALAAVGNP